MPVFPSQQWFEAVRLQFNQDEKNLGAGGGRCDCDVGLRINSQTYFLKFEGFECTSADCCTDQMLSNADFVLDMPYTDWQAMIENIRDNGHADLGFTLNTLDLEREEGLATSTHGDQYREDLFFRYNQTLQFFFDASSNIKTSF